MVTLTKEEREARDTALRITNQEFGARLAELVTHHNNILKLASKVYGLKKTERLLYAGGETVGRKELRTLSSQFGKELRSLKKNYTALGRRKKRTRTGGSAGFKNPILVMEPMRAFFSVANLGPSDPRNAASAPLAGQLAVGINGVTTRAIMTPLFNIYAHVNHMQQDPANKQFLTSTAQMDQYFQATYARLAALPQTYAKKDKDGVQKPIPRFDPKRFRYASIQSIVADNTIPKEVKPDKPRDAHKRPLTAQELEVLASPEIKARLAQEQALVSGILTIYRDQKKAAAKAAKDAGL